MACSGRASLDDRREASRTQRGFRRDLRNACQRFRERAVTLCSVHLASVGSTNFDNRSFRLNEEANLNVYDKAFAERLEDVFEEDLKQSRRITYQSCKNRPSHAKVLEKLSSFVSSQL